VYDIAMLGIQLQVVDAPPHCSYGLNAFRAHAIHNIIGIYQYMLVIYYLNRQISHLCDRTTEYGTYRMHSEHYIFTSE